MKHRVAISIFLLIVAVALIVTVVIRQKNINAAEEKELAEIRAAQAAALEEEERQKAEEEELKKLRESADPSEIFSFSRKEKNIVLITLDRAVGYYFPYIIAELPEVKEKYDGFTFYPNTVSYGNVTIFGSPAIFGGYEYTPEAINARTDELLVDKHNEALKVLPTLFGQNGYSVVMCDTPLAGYQWDPDMSIFDGLKNVLTASFLTSVSEYDTDLVTAMPSRLSPHLNCRRHSPSSGNAKACG